MSSQSQTPPEVFVSYSHLDKEYKDDLVKQLNILKRQGVISNWHDGLLVAGEKWNDHIVEHLNSSRIILLLISPDFMNSDYIHNVELKRASERHEVGAVSVIPVLVRNVNSWENEPFGDLRLGDFQALPTGAEFITDWTNRDRAFTDVAKGIQEAVKKLNLTNSESTTPGIVPRPPVVGFVARKDNEGRDIVGRLKEELAPGTNQLVALWGGGGVGKTTLAAAVARVLAADFSQRVVWVSADLRTDLPFTTFLDEIATQLGDEDLRKLAREPKSEAVRGVIAKAPTLIVLDNFETISEDERRQCLVFLQRSQCSVLITTRQRLEHARSVPIAGMAPNEAEKFLDLIIEQTQDSAIFATAYRTRLIETAETNPLIMEWIVGQIDLANDPEEVLDDLTHGEGDAAHRVFDRSYNLPQLNDGGRAVLLALSLFTPSAGRPTLAAVAGMDLGKDKDKKRFKKAQETLASLWLIKKVDGGLRLAVAGLTRELARAHLLRDPRSKAFRQRYVARFLRYAEAHDRPTSEDYDAMLAEKENVLGAIDLAFELRDWDSVQAIATAIALPVSGMLSVYGYWDEAIRRNEQALDAARQSTSESDVAVFSHNLGIMQEGRGQLPQAGRLYRESLEIAKKLGDQNGVSITLHQLAKMAYATGEMEEAYRLNNESLEIKRKLGDRAGMGVTLNNLGAIAQDRGDVSDALRLYEESLKINKEEGDQRAISSTLNNLGSLARLQGRLREARSLYNESLEIDKKLGDQKGIAASLRNLGSFAKDQGELAKGRGLCEESLEISKKLGDQNGIAVSLHELGALHIAEGDYNNAETRFQESLDMFRELGDKQAQAECLESIGTLRVSQGRLSEANGYFEEALRIAEKLGIQFRIGSVKYSLGSLVEKQGEKEPAAHLLREALTIFEMLGSPKATDARQGLERVESNFPRRARTRVREADG